MRQDLETVRLAAAQAIAHGDFATAIAHYQAAAQQPEAGVELAWELGLAYLLQGEEEQAQAIWFEAIAQLPDDAVSGQLAHLHRLLLDSGIQHLHQRRFAAAEAALRQSLELEAAAGALHHLGTAIAQQGRYEEAAACWQRSLELAPQQPEVCRQWGQMHQFLGEWETAIARYQQGLAVAPNDATLWHRLGQCQMRVGNWELAIPSLQRAAQLAPNRSAIAGDLGWSWLMRSQTEEAAFAWQQGQLPAAPLCRDYLAWGQQLEQAGRATPLIRRNLQFYQALTVGDAIAAQAALTAPGAAPTRPTPATPPSPTGSPVPAPTTVVDTTQTWLEQQGWAATHFQPLHPPSLLPLQPPLTAAAEIHPSFRFGSQVPLPAAFVATIPGGRYVIDDSRQVAAIAPDNTLLGDVSPFSPILSPGHPAAHPSRHPLLRQATLPAPTVIDGTVAVLSGLSNAVYFHWMLDVLPRLELLRQAGVDLAAVDYFLVDRDRPFQRQTLERLGIPLEKALAPAEVPHLEARSLVLPSFPASISWMPEWSLDFLRRIFLRSPWREGAVSPHRRLYITRAQAGVRRLVNEPEVIAALEPWGFEVVDLEQYSVAEQAQLFAEAAIVFAVHGSGLTNLVFCQPGTTVIELFSPYYVYPCYWLVANWRRLRYSYLLSAIPEGEFLHQQLYPDSRQEDLWLDPATAIAHLDFLGISPQRVSNTASGTP